MTNDEIVGERYSLALRRGFSKADGYSEAYLISAVESATDEISATIWGAAHALARAHAIIQIYREARASMDNADDPVGAL